MFTLKFYMEDSHHVVCTHHYAVSQLKQCVEITIYPSMNTQEGITYRVGADLGVPHFNQCYIENSAGKTIESYREL